jgi:hypothetical protein
MADDERRQAAPQSPEPSKDPRRAPHQPGRDKDEAPETPPTEPEPTPVEEPPDAPGKQAPYVVE